MRWIRAVLLLALVALATCGVAAAALDPLRDGWHAVRGASGSSSATAADAPAAELAALLTGCCALLVGLAWLWLAASVSACTWEALRVGRRGDQDRSTLLTPPLVRAVVATCLGVTALAVPAHAQLPTRVRGLPDDVRAAAVPAAATDPRLLDGLPVPDRVMGHLRARPAAPTRQLLVRPGDSLWRLTAELLPAGASAETVASGWRLVYAANRTVIGPDPDLLQPGQTLRITPALLALLRAAATGPDPGPDTGPDTRTPLDSAPGGP